MHRIRPNLISAQDAALEVGKPFGNLDSSGMKLQGLPSREVVAMICHSAEEGCVLDALGPLCWLLC